MDWLKATASDLGRAIGTGEICPSELTEAYLEAIQKHSLTQRIYTEVTRDRAVAEAREAAQRARVGARLGLLDGVPISWKDLFDSAGVATEAGSDLLSGRVPTRDAEVLRVATMGGGVCLGKTHMSELAFSGLGLNPVKETPPCVNDAGAVPGGSSSGAATSVGFDLAPLAIGSDTGGSVRIPAAWNDLVGLKTTPQRISCQGVVPLCARFDTVGPIGRSVEDMAQALALLEGGKPTDLAGVDASSLRIGVLQTIALDGLVPEVENGFDMALTRLKAAGCHVSDVVFPSLDIAMSLSPILFASEAYGTWRSVIEAAPEKMFPEILARFRGGAEILAADYVLAWQEIDRIRMQWHELVAEFDAVVLPTASILPPNHQRLLTDNAYYTSQNLLALRNTRIGNLLGLSAVSLPTAAPSVGFMVMGKPMGEEALLRVSSGIEAALRG
jgi:aspartyl-tRNA(Asn)/glutamyl-tRNA(Gln) amidotransferase subunit A